MTLSKKIQTLSQEVFRRLHNTSHLIAWEKKTSILEKFMTELRASGYSEHDRYQILHSGITSYNNLRKKEESGERPFFRNRQYQRNKRNEEKAAKKGSWFKTAENKYTTVFFVPPTPQSKLLKMLKNTEEKYSIGRSDKIKFVETAGVKYGDYYKNSNPFRSNCKPEEKCLLCKTEGNNADQQCDQHRVLHLLQELQGEGEDGLL